MAAHQTPPSLGFSRQEHCSGVPFPSPMHESEKWKWSQSVVSDSSRPRGLQPTRLLRPWDFPGKSTGVGWHCLLRNIHTYYNAIIKNQNTGKHISKYLITKRLKVSFCFHKQTGKKNNKSILFAYFCFPQTVKTQYRCEITRQYLT
jgi:hypothetical protein